MSHPQSPETRLALMEDRQDRTERTMESVADALKTLAVIEIQNDTIAKTLEDIKARVENMEKDWPVVQQIKTAAVWAAKLILCAAFVAVLTVAGFKVHA